MIILVMCNSMLEVILVYMFGSLEGGGKSREEGGVVGLVWVLVFGEFLVLEFLK